ncbi:MAG: trehalose-phosphatase [Candidatus Taylorbacteria bacterium]|nr:trehalose-phosphatase [Candidatus Taylorbacteria bacterium]
MAPFTRSKRKYLKLFAKKGGCVLILDFDGVLSPIVKNPEKAVLAKGNLDNLKRCAERFPVAIVSGRLLSDVKKRVGLPGLLYFGTHGSQWEEKGIIRNLKIGPEITKAMAEAKRELTALGRDYKGMILEDKRNTFSVHYRQMTNTDANKFVKEALGIFGPYLKAHPLRLDHDKKTFELRPDGIFDKGQSVRFCVEHFKRPGLMPIYIGDSVTDEDAFKAIPDGLSIRVRRKKGSAAKYFFKGRREVDQLVSDLAELKYA